VQPRRARRLRWSVKSALASTIAFAHQRGLAAALARGPERPLVVCYHRVVDDFEAAARTEMRSMLTSRGMFERHLDCIGRHFRFVSLDEIGERLLSGVPFTERVAAVTFDDGYHDVYEHAYPVLKRKGIPGERVGQNKSWPPKVNWVIGIGKATCRTTKPKKTDGSARSSWGLELRKQ